MPSDLKGMTVETLRELAREILGEKHARLRTKRELVSALAEAEQRVAGAAEKVAARLAQAAARLGRSAGRARAQVSRAGAKAGPGVKRVARATAKALRAGEKALGRGQKAAARAARKARAAAKPRPKGKTGAGSGRAKAPVEAPEQPVDPEGFFVARVRGEEAARQAPHPMTEAALEDVGPGAPRAAAPEVPPGPWAEWLGELPWSYGDDAFVALPRDPRTLFLYWDHARDTVAGAFAGLQDPRAQLWIFVRDEAGRFERIRTLDFALESRSYYVHDLEPGRVYRAEIHLLDRAGRERLLARPSNEMALPALGPSPILDDRFARIPWDLPLQRWLREFFPGGPFSEEARALLARLSDWSRFSGRVWGGSAGGMGGRPFSPSEAPSSPSSPWGPFGGKEGA